MKVNYLLVFFCFLTVLYYYLRFQFGYPTLVAWIQISTLTLLGLLGLRSIISGKYLFRYKLDIVLLFLLLQSVLFFVYIIFRDGIYGASWVITTTVLPILVYFFCSSYLTTSTFKLLLLTLEIIFLLVAIIYIFEFINFHILKNGLFHYSKLLNQHAINLGSYDGTSKAWTEGDLYTYIRLAGPLSHVNTTGLALALGFVLAFSRFLSKQNIWFSLASSVVFFIALLLGGGRVSIFSAGLGATVVFWNQTQYSIIKIISRTILISFIVIMVVYTLIFVGIVDIYSFSKIYSIRSIISNINILANIPEIHRYIEQIFTYPIFLITGAGPATPTQSISNLLNPILSDDLFVISLVSRYGLIIPFFLVLAIWEMFRISIKNVRLRHDKYLETILSASFGCIVTYMASTIHTGAFHRPQLFPIFFIFLSILAVIRNHQYKSYKYKIRESV